MKKYLSQISFGIKLKNRRLWVTKLKNTKNKQISYKIECKGLVVDSTGTKTIGYDSLNLSEQAFNCLILIGNEIKDRECNNTQTIFTKKLKKVN